MKIAVLSGKGGTGKTSVAVSMAKHLSYSYVDTDVEEPNGYIFLKPKISESGQVLVEVPKINNNCTYCGECSKVCQFNALAVMMDQVMVFNELCHGCKACSIICDENAISFEERPIGQYRVGETESFRFYDGLLNIKEPMAGPIISYLKAMTSSEENLIIDCSPGASCNVVKALNDVDYAVLVTEPTKFGLHDLKIAREMVETMGIPHGVIINRGNDDNRIIMDFCDFSGVKVLGVIPFLKEIAVAYSKGDDLMALEPMAAAIAGICQSVKEGAKT